MEQKGQQRIDRDMEENNCSTCTAMGKVTCLTLQQRNRTTYIIIICLPSQVGTTSDQLPLAVHVIFSMPFIT